MSSLVGFRREDPGTHPPLFYTPYGSSAKRAPTKPLICLPVTLSEITGPQFPSSVVARNAFDLTRQHRGEPLGERIVVGGRVEDEDGRPVRNSLVEIWQANSAGRYLHKNDQHNAPLDPNFTGVGHAFTNDDGQYEFVTIKPGAYPWKNHLNAWRPAHIHFSVFGPAFATRLVTQMYFPGDPLLPFDPIFNSVSLEEARNRLISSFDWATTTPDISLGFRFNIVLRGRNTTPMDL